MYEITWQDGVFKQHHQAFSCQFHIARHLRQALRLRETDEFDGLDQLGRIFWQPAHLFGHSFKSRTHTINFRILFATVLAVTKYLMYKPPDNFPVLIRHSHNEHGFQIVDKTFQFIV